ncbi:hypothetical protein BJ741DRAFT_623785 [Chytriomyces cf. hyalinus JEL632]|nr:hypothetical protein BJ741DRAFT_623785 [Chytriomyces cf. hyalinus JEL632]
MARIYGVSSKRAAWGYFVVLGIIQACDGWLGKMCGFVSTCVSAREYKSRVREIGEHIRAGSIVIHVSLRG